jgi:hypothetical protein
VRRATSQNDSSASFALVATSVRQTGLQMAVFQKRMCSSVAFSDRLDSQGEGLCLRHTALRTGERDATEPALAARLLSTHARGLTRLLKWRAGRVALRSGAGIDAEAL